MSRWSQVKNRAELREVKSMEAEKRNGESLPENRRQFRLELKALEESK